MQRLSRWCLILIGVISLLILNGCATYQSAKPQLVLQTTQFSALPGWQTANPQLSLSAFKNSCTRIANANNTENLGTESVHLLAGDLKPACRAANLLPTNADAKLARKFFETWFSPALVTNNGQADGLFTGYYVPTIHASLQKHGQYRYPIYAPPNDLIMVNLGSFRKSLQGMTIAGRVSDGKLYPYDVTRAQVNAGVLANKAAILMWADNRIDVFFMEIQGSGVAVLDNGQTLLLGYAAKNNLPYTPIGKLLVAQGELTKENVSMQSIHHWLVTHPQQANVIMDANESVVFFKIVPGNTAVGAEKVALTPGYSLAVDNHFMPYGLPVWLQTQVPNANNPNQLQTMQRLLIAQDTGGAITGPVRGDVYWGPGESAETIAGYMKSSGRYWVLLPKIFYYHM